MNTNIETALMSLIGSDPRFQRAMAMLNGKTPVEMQQRSCTYRYDSCYPYDLVIS